MYEHSTIGGQGYPQKARAFVSVSQGWEPTLSRAAVVANTMQQTRHHREEAAAPSSI